MTDVFVTGHAMWQAAERFRGFDTVKIEDEVRAALGAGRVSRERAHLGLGWTADPKSLYVWTADGDRVYAIRAANEGWVVTTTMKPSYARLR